MKTAPALGQLAEWIQSRDLKQAAVARLDRMKQHLVDIVGARIAGSRTHEGIAVSRFASSIRDPLHASVIAGCAHARCTEVDDIHLTSCTTPGSVVVPTVMALAANGDLKSMGECCAAMLAGYESMIRLGLAIDGPAALQHGVWPTHFAAAFGSAAATSRALGLNVQQTAGALATALAFGSGEPVPGMSPSSSRWMTLGIAAADGMLTARAAREDIVGSADAIPSLRALTNGLGRRHLVDDLGMKPFPTARQALAAIEAVQSIATREELAAEEITSIVAALPQGQRTIVDRPEMPATRFGSIVSLQYQIALALTAPQHLSDVERTPLVDTPELRRLMSRIRVQRARDLDARYPRAWPARVSIRANGRLFTSLVVNPKGDARRPFEWDDVERKFVRLTGGVIGEKKARQVVSETRRASRQAGIPELWDLR